METLNKLLDRLISSLLFSFCLGIASFSYFTGKFPPQKDDFSKVYHLLQQTIRTGNEVRQNGDALQQIQATGKQPSFEQIAEFQRLQLRQTETTLELIKIFERFKLDPPQAETMERLEKASAHLNATEQLMKEIREDIKKKAESMMAAPTTTQPPPSEETDSAAAATPETTVPAQ